MRKEDAIWACLKNSQVHVEALTNEERSQDIQAVGYIGGKKQRHHELGGGNQPEKEMSTLYHLLLCTANLTLT